MWKIVFSTGIVYFVYLLFGGCLFLLIEDVHQVNSENVRKINATINFTDMLRVLFENNFSDADINSTIEMWTKEMAVGYFSNDTVTPNDLSWTYYNAFFYAFHLCSTIGYGNISPLTAMGQMLSLLYATFGIPLHILYFKLLGGSFAESYQQIVMRIQGNEDSVKKTLLSVLAFFSPWTLLIFIIPSVIFMYTEDWDFIEGFYYSFITLSTVGLGDYVAGDVVYETAYYVMYKLIILCWMIYGLAFASMLQDILAYKYQINLLFVIKCNYKKWFIKIQRVYVDIEKLDIHFRLLKTENVNHKFTLWNIRTDVKKGRDFQINHFAVLAGLSEKIQGELLTLIEEEEGSSKRDAFPVKVFPV